MGIRSLGYFIAASCGMDLLGATAIGTITAIGGGTVRDAIILHKQPFWVEETEYFYMAAFVAALTFFAWPELPSGNLVKNEKGGEGSFMFWGDAVGVGAFAVVGAMNAFVPACTLDFLCYAAQLRLLLEGSRAMSYAASRHLHPVDAFSTRKQICTLPPQQQVHLRMRSSGSFTPRSLYGY